MGRVRTMPRVAGGIEMVIAPLTVVEYKYKFTTLSPPPPTCFPSVFHTLQTKQPATTPGNTPSRNTEQSSSYGSRCFQRFLSSGISSLWRFIFLLPDFLRSSLSRSSFDLRSSILEACNSCISSCSDFSFSSVARFSRMGSKARWTERETKSQLTDLKVGLRSLGNEGPIHCDLVTCRLTR